MRLAIWSPLPPSSSGVADYVAEALPELARHVDVSVVVEDPAAVDRRLAAVSTLRSPDPAPAADLDLYHIGNSPAHAYVYRRARTRPGVVFLHDWNLHQLVLYETVERGDLAAYLSAMRHAHGERGAFCGRQIARALGGQMLPALFPLGAELLDTSLAAVTLTRRTAADAAQRLAGRPALHLRHHAALLLDPLPSRADARRQLGLPADAPLVVAPGLATAQKQLDVAVRAIARLRQRWPALRLVVAGAIEPGLPLERWASEAGAADAVVSTGRLPLPDFVRALVAADVILALRFPSQGEMSGALIRALGVGRPTLVTAGTAACDDFPDGIVVPIDPGAHAEEALTTQLALLLADPALAEHIGARAHAHMSAQHSVAGTVQQLVGFLEDVAARREELAHLAVTQRAPQGSLLSHLLDEVAVTAADLGLAALPLDLEGLLRPLAGGRADANR